MALKSPQFTQSPTVLLPAFKSLAWPTQFLKSSGLIWPGLQATGPTAGRPGLSGTLILAIAMKCALNLHFKTLAANCTAVPFTFTRYLNELSRGQNVRSLPKSRHTMAPLHESRNLILHECQCDGEWLLQGGPYFSYDRSQAEYHIGTARQNDCHA
jgi:hypothetical protein